MAAPSGSFVQQFAAEVQDLIAKGKIKPDYPNSQQAKDCTIELLSFLERERPDSSRLDAARKVFLNAATETLSTREDPLPQQLIQIVATLSAGELLLLAAVSGPEGGQSYSSLHPQAWRERAAKASGLKHSDLVATHETSLFEKRLFRGSEAPSYGTPVTWGLKDRLTTLGVELCNFITTDPAVAVAPK